MVPRLRNARPEGLQPPPGSVNPGLLSKEWFSANLPLSAETFERVCLKAREINSKEKCLFKRHALCGHSGEGSHLEARVGASQGHPWTPGCGLQPGKPPESWGREMSRAVPVGPPGLTVVEGV